MKKILLVVLAVAALVASLGFASVASADEGKVRGNGTLTAQGDGLAILGGRGTVDVSGNGILWVKDKAGNATIEVTGYGEKTEFPDGWIQYAGFNGNAHIEGKRIVVMVAGVDIDLYAEGHGIAILWGHGTCVKNGETSEWTNGPGPFARFMRSHSY